MQDNDTISDYRMDHEQAFLSATEQELGGDDICFVTAVASFREATLQALMDAFLQKTDCTISFGVGKNIEDAFLNLRRAKALGGGRMIATLS